MGERKGQNKYYPPDFDYKVHNSLSGYHGQHPLRERARKLDKGILIIRFEMPYNIWCDGCNSHIGMGVRYNAEKSKIGMYYTTPIYKFRMKCHLCPMHFEIKTDPSNHDYVIIVGARRKEQRWDPTENGQIVPEDRDSQKKMVLDSMYKIEHGVIDKTKLDSLNASALISLVDQRSVHRDDFTLNQLARKKLRDAKKIDAKNKNFDNIVKKKLSLSLTLVPEQDQDVRAAKLMKMSMIKTSEDKMEDRKKKLIGEVLIPNSSTDLSKEYNQFDSVSSSRQASVKKVRQIASFNLNRIRSNAFDSKNDRIFNKSSNFKESGCSSKKSKLENAASDESKLNNYVETQYAKTLNESKEKISTNEPELNNRIVTLCTGTINDSKESISTNEPELNNGIMTLRAQLLNESEDLEQHPAAADRNSEDKLDNVLVGSSNQLNNPIVTRSTHPLNGFNDSKNSEPHAADEKLDQSTVGNVLVALSSQYESSSSSSISDDEFL